MKIVIQCAGTKHNCGSFVNDKGKEVVFVAQPTLCEDSEFYSFQKPDDLTSNGKSWRDKLIDYNLNEYNTNPLNFLKAYELYRPSAYKKLIDFLGEENVYILSAGWGLVRSDYLLPGYDITFSGSAEKSKRRKQSDKYKDFVFLEEDYSGELYFLGGKDYQKLFVKLTNHIPAKRTLIYNSEKPSSFKGIETISYKVKQKTNWHYTCVDSIITGSFVL